MVNLKEFRDELNSWYEHRVCSNFPSVARADIEHRGLVVYGASTMGKSFTSQLIEYGITPKWIVDKNPKLSGKSVNGIKVRSLDSLNEVSDSFVLLASTHMKEMAEICDSYNANWILPYSTHSFCRLLTDIGIIGTGDESVDNPVEVIQLMHDQKSIEIFKAFLRYHYVLDNDFSHLCDPIEYFPHDLKSIIDYRFFVDAGAFNGDTLKTWIRRSSALNGEFAYYAFEPSKTAYSELRNLSDGLAFKNNVHLFNIGLGSEPFKSKVIADSEGMNTIASKSTSAETSLESSEGQIEVNTIDNTLTGKTVTVIKADIEGFEMDLLRGAERTIREQRPALMISVYHKFSDIFQIPQWIYGLDLNYDIYLRHAPKVFTDTTCYAIPRK
jgi:FkbM family methyltransferase